MIQQCFTTMNGRTVFATRKYLLIGAAIATAVTLSACSGGNTPGMDMGQTSSSSSKPGADATATFNDADVTFAQMMIPHHQQAVEMSDVILAKDGIDQRVVDLATEIKAAQEPEIKQLNTWLTDWGADFTAMPGIDHGVEGMMSQSDMDALNAATGVEASKLFLEQMAMHHEGATKMAKSEVNDGKNADAIKTAETIVTSQTDEIAVMKDLLASL
jgi:uncharacterized protein (DUF305 family)